jgi:4-hydroxybenzoate polyprenyltransferase
MIKWEHSIFVLPFALCGAMLAANGLPSGRALAWIIIAMVTARSAAMAFNRLADASIDAANPRTQTRALPAGTLTPGFVITFVLVSCTLFVFAASQLNRLSFILSPFALAVVLLYSYTKRFTRWSHLVLGFAMGIAPSAARSICASCSLLPRSLSGAPASMCFTPVRISTSINMPGCTRFHAISASANLFGSRDVFI